MASVTLDILLGRQPHPWIRTTTLVTHYDSKDPKARPQRLAGGADVAAALRIHYVGIYSLVKKPEIYWSDKGSALPYDMADLGETYFMVPSAILRLDVKKPGNVIAYSGNIATGGGIFDALLGGEEDLFAELDDEEYKKTCGANICEMSASDLDILYNHLNPSTRAFFPVFTCKGEDCVEMGVATLFHADSWKMVGDKWVFGK